MIDDKGNVTCDVCKKAQVVTKDWYSINALPAKIDLRRVDAKIDGERKLAAAVANVVLIMDALDEASSLTPKEDAPVEPEARFDVCDECVNDRVLGSWGAEALAAMGLVKS